MHSASGWITFEIGNRATLSHRLHVAEATPKSAAISFNGGLPWSFMRQFFSNGPSS